MSQVTTRVGRITWCQACLSASLLLPLHLHRLQRMKPMMMAPVTMMMMRMRMLAFPVMRRWLLLN